MPSLIWSWVGTISLLIGAGVNGFGIYPLGVLLMTFGGCMWVVVGILRKDFALIVTNFGIIVISLVGVIYNFLK